MRYTVQRTDLDVDAECASCCVRCLTGGTEVTYNKFDLNASSTRDNDSEYSCAVAMATGQWKITPCSDRHLVVCQSHHLLTGRL